MDDIDKLFPPTKNNATEIVDENVSIIDDTFLKQAMEQYGNMRYHVESLEANQKTILKSILEKHPEIKQEYEEAEEELGNQLKQAQEQVKNFRKILDMAIEQYARTAPISDKLVLKTELLRVSFTNKGGEYDADALDELVKQGHIELLKHRTDKGVSTRIDLNKL